MQDQAMGTGADRDPPSTFSQIPAWAAFFGVTLLEYLVLSQMFDAKDLVEPAGLEHLFGHVGELFPLGFMILAATLLVAGQGARKALDTLAPFRRLGLRVSLLWLVHLLFFATTAALGMKLKGVDAHVASPPRELFFLFCLAATGTLVTVCLATWRVRTMRQAFHGLHRPLLIGAAVGAIAWSAGVGVRLLWQPLAWLTLEIVHALLTLIFEDAVASVEHFVVGTERFFVTVAPECSGIEGVGVMFIFVSAYLYIHRQRLRWPLAATILPMAVVVMWLVNSVRLTALILLGTWYSPEVALGGFHARAGWLLFTFVALATMVFVGRSRIYARAGAPLEVSASTQERGSATSPEVVYLLPLLSVLSVSLATSLFTSGFDHFYPLRVVVVALVLWTFRRHYRVEKWSPPWLALALGLALAALWIWGFAEPTDTSIDTGEVLAGLHPVWASVWLAFRVIGTTITVPLIEELAFRGYLMRRITRQEFESLDYRQAGWLGLFVSSLAFGLLHSQWLLGLAAGFVFGLLAMTRGRLTDAIVAHALTNLVLVLYVFWSGNWALLP